MFPYIVPNLLKNKLAQEHIKEQGDDVTLLQITSTY